MGQTHVGTWLLALVPRRFRPRTRSPPTPRLRTQQRSKIDAIVRSLIAQKADVNQAQADGMTALHWSAYHDDLETAKLLVYAKANVNAVNRYGVTPLSLACATRRRSNGQALARCRRRAPTPNWRRETPLMIAARTGKVGPREGVARPRGGRQRARATQPDGPDVGGGRRTCEGRRAPARGGGRLPHTVVVRIHAAVLRGARGCDRRRSHPAQGGHRRQ